MFEVFNADFLQFGWVLETEVSHELFVEFVMELQFVFEKFAHFGDERVVLNDDADTVDDCCPLVGVLKYLLWAFSDYVSYEEKTFEHEVGGVGTGGLDVGPDCGFEFLDFATFFVEFG